MNISGYIIDKQIGKGGMAMVYRATQESLGRPVALKVMSPLFSDTPEFSERFLDEGRLLAAVHHANIITIHDIGISDGFHFISMEYVEGGDLGEKIKEGISASQATTYLKSLVECLSVAHDLHIVHRDIKPANILFRKDGTLLLTDFGIAKQLTNEKGLTATGSMIGSPHYLSPEQAQGKRVDGRADIYSLGVLFYEMLVGERPFTGDSDIDIAIKHVTEPVPDLPEAFAAYSAVIDRMTRKKPDDRFPSCKSLLAALGELEETGRWSGEIADIPLPSIADSSAVPTGKQAATPSHRKSTDNGGAAVEVDADTSGSDDGQPIATGTQTADTLVLDANQIHDGHTIVEQSVPDTTEDRKDETVKVTQDAENTKAIDVPLLSGRDTVFRRRWMMSVFGISLVVLAAVVIRFFFVDQTKTASDIEDRKVTAVPQSRVGGTALTKEEKDRRAREALIESYLNEGRAAIAAYRLTTPQATSAYTYYQKVLAIEPNHADAQKGINEIADVYFALAQKAEKKWDYEKATQYAATGIEVRPNHEALRTLMQKLKSDDGKTGRTLKKTFKGVKGWFD